MNEQYLSTASVAKRWDCSPDLVRKLIRHGVLKAISLTSGKRVSYRVALRVVERYESQMGRSAIGSRVQISQAAIDYLKNRF